VTLPARSTVQSALLSALPYPRVPQALVGEVAGVLGCSAGVVWPELVVMVTAGEVAVDRGVVRRIGGRDG
jgi:hypothetical protein